MAPRREQRAPYSAGRHRRRSARRHEPLRHRRAQCARRARGVGAAAGCCTRPTSTWRSWSSARAPATWSISTRRSDSTCARSRRRSSRDVEDLVVIVLDRPRHEKLIDEIRATGARIRLIGDGDLSAGIAAAVVGTGVHAVMGTGGAPEGVLTAAAMRCLGGEIYARLVVQQPEHEERCRAMGITDSQARSIARRISRSGDEHHVRGDRRDRRHADERRALLRRRHPHHVARHADAPAPDPLHRQHPRPSQGIDREDPASSAVRGLTWRRNQVAVTAASLRRLHRLHAGDAVSRLLRPGTRLSPTLVTSRCGRGLTLGVDAGRHCAVRAVWGRVGDRFGNKLLVDAGALRASCIVMACMAMRGRAVASLRPACRSRGSSPATVRCTLSMAAMSRSREQMARAIGTVQTAQRIGPAVGPVIGGLLRCCGRAADAFLVSAAVYAGRVLTWSTFMYTEPSRDSEQDGERASRVSFGTVLAFENFVLLMAVIFGLQAGRSQFRSRAASARHGARLLGRRGRLPSWLACCFRCWRCAPRSGNQLAAAFLKRRHDACGRHRGRCSSAVGDRWRRSPLAQSVWLMTVTIAPFGAAIGTAHDDDIYGCRIGRATRSARRRFRFPVERIVDRLGDQSRSERAGRVDGASESCFFPVLRCCS